MPLDIVNNGETGLVVRSKLNVWEASIVANIADITALEADVATNTTNIATNAANIVTNTTNIATNASGISTLNTTVSGLVTAVNTHTSQIATLTTNTATNTTNIATNTTNIATNTADILLKQAKDGIDTLRDDYRAETGNFAISNTTNTQFVNFTGAASGCSVPDDATIPLVARGKHFAFWNNNASSGDVTLTPGGGVTIEYAGSLNATVIVGIYCELIHTGTDRWLRIH